MRHLANRRNFLKTCLVAGTAATSLSTLAPLSAQAVEPFKRTGGPRLRLSLAAYSFREYFNHKDPAKRITLFDFDDCCYGWFVMDIAMPLMDFLVLYPGIERERVAVRFLSSFLRGYLPQHPLDADWLQQLPVFLKLLESGLYYQVHAFAKSFPPDSWVGKFMAGRRECIENGMPFVELDIPAIIASLA